jgi:glycosyltransferase involved in cell wall biosynthesis
VKILQLVPRLPYPATDGGKIGILGITEGYLAHGAQVWLAGFDQDRTAEEFARVVGPRLSGWSSRPLSKLDDARAAALGLALDRPFLREKYWSRELMRTVANAVRSFRPDFVHLDHSHMGAYGLELKRLFPTLPCVVRAHNVDYVIWERMASARAGLAAPLYRRQAASVRRYERLLFASLDGVVPLTDVDAARVRELAPEARVYVMPAGCTLRPPSIVRPDAEIAPRFAFVGHLDWAANRDGIEWFVREIWPSLRARWGDARLDVIGRNSGAPLPTAEAVTYHGFVDNLDVALAGADLAVVPLRVGGGMRLKILDFMSRGLPVISTAIGAEGIPPEWEGRRTWFAAEDADGFVAATAELLRGPDARASVAAAGRSLVSARYEWRALVGALADWALGSGVRDAVSAGRR